jgi:hypothetical protein
MVHKQYKPNWLPWLPILSTVKNLVAIVTMRQKQIKPAAVQGSPNNFEPQTF